MSNSICFNKTELFSILLDLGVLPHESKLKQFDYSSYRGNVWFKSISLNIQVYSCRKSQVTVYYYDDNGKEIEYKVFRIVDNFWSLVYHTRLGHLVYYKVIENGHCVREKSL